MVLRLTLFVPNRSFGNLNVRRTGFDAISGQETTPLFSWNVPAWKKTPSDSGKYNYEVKIPEQLSLTSSPSGEAGMTSEVFESFDEYKSKKEWGMGISAGVVGLSESFALSAATSKMRSATQSYNVGLSKQRIELYRLSVRPEIISTCPYSPAFASEDELAPAAEEESGEQAAEASAEKLQPTQPVESWTPQNVRDWLLSISMASPIPEVGRPPFLLLLLLLSVCLSQLTLP
jgi:hypothetical protein